MTNTKAHYEAKIRELQRQIEEQEKTIERLSLDPSYGILTRQALEIDLEARKKEVRFVVFGDVDYLHRFNSTHGHEEANRRIRRALHFRSSDIVLAGKWYSGDEIAILLSGGDPSGYCKSLQRAFIDEGMSITISWAPFSGNIERDVAKAKKVVETLKSARGSDR